MKATKGHNQNFKRFSNALGVLCELYDKRLSPIAIQTYYRALEKYSVEQIEAAFSNAIVSSKFFPRPAELAEFITGSKQALEDRAEVLAREVVEQIRTVGSYGVPEISDPIMALVVTQYGWGALCRTNVKYQGFIIKDLVKGYLAHTRDKDFLQLEQSETKQISE